MRSKKLRLAAIALSMAMVATSVPQAVLAADLFSDSGSEDIAFEIVDEEVDIVDEFSSGAVAEEAPAEVDFFAEGVAEDVYLGEVSANVTYTNVRIIDMSMDTVSDSYVNGTAESGYKDQDPDKDVSVASIMANAGAEDIVINGVNFGKLVIAYNSTAADGTKAAPKYEALTAADINFRDLEAKDTQRSCENGALYNVTHTFKDSDVTWDYWASSKYSKYLESYEGGTGHTWSKTTQTRYMKGDDGKLKTGNCADGTKAEVFMDIQCENCGKWFSEVAPAEEVKKAQLGPEFPQEVDPQHTKNADVALITRYSKEKELAKVNENLKADAEGLKTSIPKDAEGNIDYPYYIYKLATCIYDHTYVESITPVVRPSTGNKYVIVVGANDNITATSAAELTTAGDNGDGIVNQAAADPVAVLTNDKIVLKDCSKPGYYRIYRQSEDYDENDNPINIQRNLVKTVTVEPHHVVDYVEIWISTDGKGTRVNPTEKTKIDNNKDFEVVTNTSQYVNYYRKDGVLHVVSKDCNTVPYTLITYCKSDKANANYTDATKEQHKIPEDQVLASELGAHVYDKVLEQTVDDFAAHKLAADFVAAMVAEDKKGEFDGEVTLANLQRVINYYNTSKGRLEEDSVLAKVLVGYANGTLLWEGAATCTTAGTVKVEFICGANSAHRYQKTYTLEKPLGHDESVTAVVIENVPATCTEDGYFVSAKTCPRCGEVFDKNKYVLTKLGHDFLTDKGDNKNVVLGTEGTVIVDNQADATGDKGALEASFAADPKANVGAVLNNGLRSVKVVLQDVCTRCGEKKTIAGNPDKVVIDKFEKAGNYCQEKQITFTATKKKTVDGKSVTEKETFTFPYYSTPFDYAARTNHEPGEPVMENVVPATEKTEGSYDSVIYCSKCGYEIARRPMTTPVLSHVHTMTKTEAKEATCEEAGNIEYYTCSGCGNFYADEAGETQIAQEDTVAPAGHKYVAVEAKEPTVDEEGNIAYFVCERCGKLFLLNDNDEYVETTEEEVKIAKLVPLPAKVTGVKTNMYPSDAYPTKGYAQISWDAVDGADNYRVSVRLLGTTEWTKIETNSTETSYKVPEPLITVGMSYEIRVAAGKEGVFGPRSDVIRRYYESVTPTYTKTSNTITVSWDAVEKGSSYMVIYSENKSMKPYKTIIVRNGITSATIRNLKADTRYYIRVRPYDKTIKTATGALSPLKSVKTAK